MLEATIMIDGVLCDYRTKKPLGLLDGSATIGIQSVVHGNISMLDAKVKLPIISARQAYIDSLSKPPKTHSVLTQEYRERNHRASLGGFAPYTTPENGGVES